MGSPVSERLSCDLLEQVNVCQERLSENHPLLGRELRPGRLSAAVQLADQGLAHLTPHLRGQKCPDASTRSHHWPDRLGPHTRADKWPRVVGRDSLYGVLTD